MTEPLSHPYYRHFQKFALGVGLIAAIIGFAIQNPLVWMAGLVTLVHGMTATAVIAMEDRRKSSGKGK